MLLRGEWAAGAGQGVDHLLGIFFGTGVGAAYLESGVPFRGAGYALEIGHLPFRGDGRSLEGLRTDCLEAYVSGRVLRDIAERHQVAIAEVFARAQESELLAREVLQFIHDLAMAVGIAVALFSPDAIVLGGGICEMAGFPRDDVAGLIEENAPFQSTGRKMDLRWASLGWEAALHGAQITAAEAMTGNT
jgi:allose kinase